jgi:methylated-DNA-[protein]-cysteine S-methyltransferase
VPFLLFETALGPTGLAWNASGIAAIQLPEATRAATRARLAAKAPAGAEEIADGAAPPWVREAIERIRRHLDGSPQDFSAVRLDLARVTPFLARIYAAARRIPSGRTASYGELARDAGSPRAARAVGRAMATNPFPIVVPCHRVLASGGKPGGFSAFGGLITKDRLLGLEKAPARLPFDAAEALRHLGAADPVLGRHIARVGAFSLRLKETPDPFLALAEAIVYQQLSGKAAATIFGRLTALYAKGRLEPRAVLGTKDRALRGVGLSRAKVASLRDLATRSTEGQVPTLAALATMDDEAIVEALTEVRGIGRWTAEMLLIFRLGRPDVLPLADFGIRKAFAKLFPSRRGRHDGLASPAEVARRGERWRPYRSVASWYLWRALDA